MQLLLNQTQVRLLQTQMLHEVISVFSDNYSNAVNVFLHGEQNTAPVSNQVHTNTTGDTSQKYSFTAQWIRKELILQ